MRIRVVINRYLLPPTKIWWDLDSSFAPGEDRTVFVFLGKVSAIIPLDAGNWGLEDYAVEIDGFEILHFQEIETVVRDGDQVVIRPLSGTEIRGRKRSGRRQISIYGRKLIDGTPLGRTMIKPAPDRPPIIPPRKRLKIGNGEVDDSVVVEAQDDYWNSDSDTESERDPDDAHGHDPRFDHFHDNEDPSKRSMDRREDDDMYGDIEDPVGSLFEEEVLGNTMTLIGNELDSTDESDDEDFEPEQTELEGEEEETEAVSADEEAEDEEEEEAAADEEQEEAAADEEEEEADAESEEELDYVNFLLNEELDGSEEENFVPTESEEEFSDSEEDLENLSHELSAIESDISMPAPPTPAVSQSPQKKSPIERATTPDTLPHQPAERTKAKESSAGRATAPGTVPHEGAKRTKARNERRKHSRALNRLKQQGILPLEADIETYKKWLASQKSDNNGNDPEPVLTATKKQTQAQQQPAVQEAESAAAKPPSSASSSSTSSDSESEAEKPKKSKKHSKEKKQPKIKSKYKKAFKKAKKKKTILESWDIRKFIEERKREKRRKKQQRESSSEDSEASDAEKEEVRDATPPLLSSKIQEMTPTEPPTEISSRRRDPEVELGAVQREIFNEQPANTRAMGKARKIRYDDEGNLIEGTKDALAQKDPNAWKEKIVLSAVECELEDVQLPKPGFPFVQPYVQEYGQNKHQAGKKRKRKGNNKRDEHHEDTYEDTYDDRFEYGYDNTGYNEETYNENFYDEPEPVLEPTPVEEDDGLPPLPEDISALENLTPPVLPGTVVAFKQLTMDDNYRPILADYRTAIVEAVYEEADGQLLEMKLAVRDRPKKKFDQETGERILGKFEMPGADDEVEGKLELMVGELIEPKVLKLPEQTEEGKEEAEGGKNESDEDEEQSKEQGSGDEESVAEEDKQTGGEQDDAMEEFHWDGGDEIESSERGNGDDEGEPEMMEIESGSDAGIEPSFMKDMDKAPEPLLSDPSAETETEQANHDLQSAKDAILSHLQTMEADDHLAPNSPPSDPILNTPPLSTSNPISTPPPSTSAKDTTPASPSTVKVAGSAPISLDSDSDSDGLPTLEKILVSSQSVKQESAAEYASPFGTLGGRTSEEKSRSPDEEQIQLEASLRGGVKVIDLTSSGNKSAGDEQEKENREANRGRRGRGRWRAVSSRRG
ncbi:hypothetical protein RUND412_000579 [Rhizina undulata]